jgi:hypothetical protein
METKSWKEIKDTVYGAKGTDRRDAIERDFGDESPTAMHLSNELSF